MGFPAAFSPLGAGRMESLYWVFTYRCNDRCAHCYNESGPNGRTLPLPDCLRIVANLPDRMGRLILSGGEPLVELRKLLAICDAVRERFGPDLPLMIQTNGDLLSDDVLGELDCHGVDRIDVVSMDRWHRQRGRRRGELGRLFRSAEWREDSDGLPLTEKRVFCFWGASEDLWLEGNWPRGRALESKAARLDPDHNFCGLWSGAVGFFDDGSPSQEVAIQLYQVFPCCPATWFSLGDARREKVMDILERYRGEPAFQALNRGEPASPAGVEVGAQYAARRLRDLGSVCLWCDEFFRDHYAGPRGERRHFR